MNSVDIFWFVIISTLVGWSLGQIASMIWQRQLTKHGNPSITLREQAELDNVILLTVETADSQYLCYNSVTQEFVCQGSDLDQIVQGFKKRYPNMHAAIYKGEKTVVADLKAQYDKTIENSNLQ